ncbi:MAG: heparinase II/III family protein [Mangrovibacterium sp.]
MAIPMTAVVMKDLHIGEGAGASLFQCLDLLKRATGSKFNVFDNHLIKSIGSYIYKVYIEYPYFINFADADAITGSRPDIIFEYGKTTGDSLMQKFGAYLAQKQNWGQKTPDGKVDEQISQLMEIKEIEDFHAEDVLISDFWLPNIEVAGGRDNAGLSKGFFFAAKGGNNAESHNHNDVGSCIVYYNGKPCIIDIGREKYTAKTFSSNRYDIWTMQSQYHNLPKINGVDQRNGREFKTGHTFCKADDKQVTFSTDIALAYPEEAGVKKWERIYQLQRGKRFIVKDLYELRKITDTTSINLILYCKINRVKPGIIHLTGYDDDYNLELRYNPNILTPRIEFHEVTDSGLKRFWPNGTVRIVFTMHSSDKKGESTISINPL